MREEEERDTEIELLDLANKSTACPIKCAFLGKIILCI